jgi:hypothetical protein
VESSVTEITKQNMFIIFDRVTEEASLAVIALPIIALHRLHYLCRKVQAGWVCIALAF